MKSRYTIYVYANKTYRNGSEQIGKIVLSGKLLWQTVARKEVALLTSLGCCVGGWRLVAPSHLSSAGSSFSERCGVPGPSGERH